MTAHLTDLRVKIRTVVLAMGASGDGPDDDDIEPIGASEVYNGIRFRKCSEIGQPLQEAVC